MSSPVLHIKDSYFFEVPKALHRSHRQDRSEFPDFWVALDDGYLGWEAKRYVKIASEEGVDIPDGHGLLETYPHWLHSHPGKPFLAFVQSQDWFVARSVELEQQTTLSKRARTQPDEAAAAKVRVDELRTWFEKYDDVQLKARDVAAYRSEAPAWSPEKLAGYNRALDGKILIPQPFGGTLRNLHEPMDGFCLSKFMIIQIVVALMMSLFFIRLANRMRQSDRPKGRWWNFLEMLLVFVRDDVGASAMGATDGRRFTPLLWGLFFFILGMNLMGMIPWVGAPTGAFGVTLGMAAVTFLAGLIMGTKKFGFVGYWLNLIPQMDLPIWIAVFIKPVIFVIELLGLAIRHLVLGIRLLANMVAGHLVLLAIMTMAFSVQGAMSSSWWITAPISVLGSTLFSILELFVAFLQAYVFTFLSALFIGASVHHH